MQSNHTQVLMQLQVTLQCHSTFNHYCIMNIYYEPVVFLLLTILLYGFIIHDVMNEVFAVTCVYACTALLGPRAVQC